MVQQRKIHPQGPSLSRIICGAWRWHTISPGVVERLIDTALEQGITSFDHADIYGDHSNEELFGNVIRVRPSLREKMQLITKCGIQLLSSKRPSNLLKHYDTSAGHISAAVENSLKVLGTDRLDVLLIHRPDPLMDPHEIAATFDSLRRQGKILHFGVSNFTSSQFRMLQRHMDFPLVTNQIEISLSRIDPFFNGDLDTLMEFNASPMAWSPLGGGRLPESDERLMFNKAAKLNATCPQLSLAWLMKHPASIFPIIGTTKPERVSEAARSTEIGLDRQDWFEMLKWVTKKDVP